MNEEKIMKIFEMISAAGAARSKYIEAIRFAKSGEYEKAQEAIKEGSELFVQAHDVHTKMLSTEADGIEKTGSASDISLILVHAEDQMMCAETFRILAEEFIDLYKKVNN